MIKITTRDKLLQIYKKYGKEVAIETARKSLKIGTKDGDFKKIFNGEVCEVALEIILMDFIAKKHPDWFYIKGLVLPDAEHKGDFLTEIDFVVFSPQFVYCIECKSFSGDKRAVNEGTIVLKSGIERDVYAQNMLHLEVLDKMICNFSKQPKYKMFLFNFSSGELKDERDADFRKLFPIVDETNVLAHFQEQGSIIWDLQGLRLAKERLEKFSNANRQRHLEYVKTLHNVE